MAPIAPSGFRILPGKVTIEIEQEIRFRGELSTVTGQLPAASLAWDASGGTIDTAGNFSARKPGTYVVIGRGRGRTHGQRPDSSVVVVIPRLPGIVGIRVSPRRPKLSAGETREFRAMGRLRNGSAAEMGVVWSATGGSIDPAGVYRAGSAAGNYQVIATNTRGTVADTVPLSISMTPLPDTLPLPNPNPDPTPNPEPTPGVARLVLKPATVVLATRANHQFAAFGRTLAGDSVAVDVTYRATGGTITSTGLYTAGQTAGSFRIIATSAALADTSMVTLAATSGGGAPTPIPGPLPNPTPAPGGTGIPVGLSGLLSSGREPLHYSGSLDGYTAQNILPRLTEARQKKIRLLMNLTGGMHDNYKTNGKFDPAKWQAKMDSYNTPAIKAAVAAAVADGTIIGASVMDEPHQDDSSGFPEKSWGPAGWMTKARVDGLCGYVKSIFPTMPVGVNHDHRHFEPEKNYAVCDFLGTQYRASKGPVTAWRDGALAFARRSGMQVVFGLNILHGGPAGSSCAKYGDDPRGTLCPMTPTQVREVGMALGPQACALNMWRYERAYFDDPDAQAAVRYLSDSLGRLARKPCTRS